MPTTHMILVDISDMVTDLKSVHERLQQVSEQLTSDELGAGQITELQILPVSGGHDYVAILGGTERGALIASRHIREAAPARTQTLGCVEPDLLTLVDGVVPRTKKVTPWLNEAAGPGGTVPGS